MIIPLRKRTLARKRTGRPPVPGSSRCAKGAANVLRALAVAGSMAATSVATAVVGEEFFDRVEQALTTSTFDGRFRARLSGTMDLEGYQFSGPAPALLTTKEHQLFSPRLTLFLDAQAGEHAYLFLQARADRGFDPGDRNGEVRLDEYALRLGPWSAGKVHLQVGRFATVVGNWTSRHTSWVNPFVSAPLVYENLTGIWDNEALHAVETMLRWSHVRPGLAPHLATIEKSLRVPVIWGPSYATGISVAGEIGDMRYAVEVKNAALGSRPESWGRFDGYWEHPTVSGRLGYRPSPTWNFGVSASGGSYLTPAAERTVFAGTNRGDYRQLVLAHDLSFAWRHFQLWAEVFATRFEVPDIGDAETLAYYVEAKYKLAPQLFGAVRWNQQFFGTVPEGSNRFRWGREAWRMDFGVGYRLTAHMQLKLQYNLQRGDIDRRKYGHLFAAQMTVRF